MQRISVNLTNYCNGNQLNYNNDLPVIGNKNYALQKPFATDFLTVIGNAKLWPSFVICWVAQGSRPRCGPRHPTYFALQHICLCKIICHNYFIVNSLKFTWILDLWYVLELSDPFIKNENSVLPILIEKNWTKNLLLSLENKAYFF